MGCVKSGEAVLGDRFLDNHGMRCGFQFCYYSAKRGIARLVDGGGKRIVFDEEKRSGLPHFSGIGAFWLLQNPQGGKIGAAQFPKLGIFRRGRHDVTERLSSERAV